MSATGVVKRCSKTFLRSRSVIHGCRTDLRVEAASKKMHAQQAEVSRSRKLHKAIGQHRFQPRPPRNMTAVNGVDANISARDVGEQVRRHLKRSVALVKLALKTHAAETLHLSRAPRRFLLYISQRFALECVLQYVATLCVARRCSNSFGT